MLRTLALATALFTPLFAVELQLPTENHHLFTGEPEKFYMYVDRTFEGETSKPWEGGSFGFGTPEAIVQGAARAGIASRAN